MSTINLLPEDYLHKRTQRRANMLCLTLFVVVMTGVVGAAIVSDQSYRYTLKVGERVDAEYAKAARLIDEMQRLEQRKTTLIDKAENTANLMERVPRSYLLSAITNCRPEHVSLVKLELKTVRVQPKPPANPAGKGQSKAAKLKQQAEQAEQSPQPVQTWAEVVLTGRARTDVEVARYISTLAQNPLMKSVDLIYSKEAQHNETGVRDFQLELVTQPNADVIDVLQPDPGAEQVAGVQTGVQP